MKEMQAMKVNVTEIQHFCTHDGPGIRTVVFMNGCPLSCKWCHNPEARLTGNRIFFTENSCIGCQSCALCSAHIFTEAGHLFDRSKCVNCGKCAAVCPSGALENTVFTAVSYTHLDVYKRQPIMSVETTAASRRSMKYNRRQYFM